MLALLRSQAMPIAPWSVGSRIGELTLEARLGAGGMGEVFRARHVASGAAVAVKVFAPGYDPADGLRAAREREAHARVSAHPNVGRIHGAGEASGRRYLAGSAGKRRRPRRCSRRRTRSACCAADGSRAS